MTRSRSGLADPELLHEHGGLVGFELAELHLDLRRQGLDHRALVPIRGRDLGHEPAGVADRPLPHVQQDEYRLLGEESEAADGLGLVGVEGQVADRGPGLEALVDPAQDDLLALGRLPLRLRTVLAAALQPVEPSLGHREVCEGELQIELLEVAGRIDAAGRVRVGWILERPDDVEQRVGIAQAGQVIGRQLLGPDPALGRGRRGRQVDVGHVGLDDLLGLEDLGESVEPVVRDLDDADVEGDPAIPAGLGVAAGQGVEDGRLAAPGKADDGDLHRPIVAVGGP